METSNIEYYDVQYVAERTINQSNEPISLYYYSYFHLIYQIYNQDYCKCECMNESEERECQWNHQKIWNEETCQCVCKAEEFKHCGSGYVYDDIDSCK